MSVRNKIVTRPSKHIGPPTVEHWLEEVHGQPGAVVHMVQNPGGTPRKLMTVYEDGGGYLNMNNQIKVNGIEFEKGRLVMRHHENDEHSRRCGCRCCSH